MHHFNARYQKGKRGGCGREGVYGNSVLSVQFFCKPRTALKSGIFVVVFFKGSWPRRSQRTWALKSVSFTKCLCNLYWSKYCTCPILSYLYYPNEVDSEAADLSCLTALKKGRIKGATKQYHFMPKIKNTNCHTGMTIMENCNWI